MSNKQDQLKALNLQSKEIAAERKKIREELAKTKSQRSDANAKIILAKKSIKNIKAQLREATANTSVMIKSNNINQTRQLAEEIALLGTLLNEQLKIIADQWEILESL